MSAPTHSACPLSKKRKRNDLLFVLDHFKKVEDCSVDDPNIKFNCHDKMYTCVTQRKMRLQSYKTVYLHVLKILINVSH